MNKNKAGRWLALTAVVISAVVSGCGSPSGRHLTLWLDYTPWGAHVPIFVAQAKGYFAKEGIEVSIRSPANVTDPLKLVASSSSAVGLGYMSDVVTAESRGIPVVSTGAYVQHHLNCIMTLKSSGITSPRQLAGKRMGSAETPADDVILNTVYRRAGVLGKVHAVNLNYDYVPALLDHRVDAIEGGYQVWEKIAIEQEGQKVNVIQLQRWGVPDEYELVLIAGRRLIHSDPTTVRRFMKALMLGERFSLEHPATAVNLFIKQNPSYATASGRYLVSHSWNSLIPFVQPKGVRFLSQTRARWASLARWMYRNKLIQRRPPVSALFTDRFDR
jgi:putative hydroxymethylpyrimidine transport system substrate-binding protein